MEKPIRTFWDKLGYIFAPADSKGVGFFDRLMLIGAMGAQDAWQARKEQPAEQFLVNTVAALSAKMGIKDPPHVILYKSDIPNAASIVSGNIVIGTNILDIMTPGQVQAVIGHELAHHRHRARDLPIMFGIPIAYDVISEVIRAQVWRTSSPKSKEIVRVVHGAGLYAANVALPLAYMRQLEYEADKEGAYFTHPEHMSGALEALERRSAELKEEHEKTRPQGRSEHRERPPKWWERDHPETELRLLRIKLLQEKMERDGLLKKEEKLSPDGISR